VTSKSHFLGDFYQKMTFCKKNTIACFKFTAMRSFFACYSVKGKVLFGKVLKNARFLKGAA